MFPPRIATVALLLITFAPLARAGDLNPIMPADTETYFSINVRQIVDSPLFQKQILPSIKETLDEAGGADGKKVLKDLGLDPFKDIERITIVSPGTNETDRGLIFAHGTFDAVKFKTKADEVARDTPDHLKIHKVPLGGGTTHEVYEVVVPQQDTSLFVAVANNKLLLASPGKDYVVDALKAARDRKKVTLKNKEFQSLLEKLDTKQSVSVAFLGKAIAQSDNDTVPKFVTDAFANVEAIGGGLNINTEVKLGILLASKDTESAKNMHAALDKGLKLALVGLSLLGEERKELTLLLDFVKAIKVSNRGKVVTITGRLSQDTIEDFFKKDG
jgi:hypothetical protein